MMQHPFYDMTENIDKPYYFGVGGIGDFLLLMATFYDDVEAGSVDVVFVANNIKPLQWLTSDTQQLGNMRPSPFRKINRFWFFPRKAFQLREDIWNALEQHKEEGKLLGTGVTPARFNYVGDWNKCGESTVFDYYGVNRNPTWASQWAMHAKYGLVVIQPFGGADDPTKIKQLSSELLHNLVNIKHRNHPIVFIGSTSDMEEMQAEKWSPREDYIPITYCTDIKEAVNYIKLSDVFHGADSWGKTWAALSGKKQVNVYKNKYIAYTPEEMFGQDTDPGDYVFLKDWGFNILDDIEII